MPTSPKARNIVKAVNGQIVTLSEESLNEEPSKKALFDMIARPVKSLVHFMALKMVQKCGPCLL